MTDLLHRIHMGTLNFDHAGCFDDPEYRALSAEEKAYQDRLKAVMGDDFTLKYLAAGAAVQAYAADKDFQEGMRLGAQLMLALLKPLG